jgi:hypothetical protein
VSEVEAGIVATYDVIAQRGVAEVFGIFHAPRNYRIRINAGGARKTSLRLGGLSGK